MQATITTKPTVTKRIGVSMKVKFTFTNIDNSLYTKEECSVIMEVQADDESTAFILSMHLQKVLGADYFNFVE